MALFAAKDSSVRPSKEAQVLVSLALVYLSNQWCRALLFSTVNFGSDDAFRYANAALGLSEADYALLGTLAFQVLFSFASLAAGAAVDKVDARLASVVACVTWSVATAAIGLAGNSFETVAALRALQGLAMAVTAPAGYSLLAKTFDSSKLASANSAYAAAVSVGGALASASVALDETIGWRSTFAVVGAIGIGIAFLAAAGLLLNDGGPENNDQETRRSSAAALRKTEVDSSEESPFWSFLNNPATLFIFGTTAVRYCAGFTIAVFALPVFREKFPENAVEFGVAYAVTVAVFGSASAFAGGRLADIVAERKIIKVWPFDRNPNAARAVVPCVGSALAAPLWLFATRTAPSLDFAILGLALEFLVAECWIGTTAALLANEVPQTSRGFAQGLFTALTIVGNLAPLAVGKVSEKGVFQVGDLVDCAVVAAYLLSSLGFAATAAFLTEPPPPLRKDAMKSN